MAALGIILLALCLLFLLVLVANSFNNQSKKGKNNGKQ